MIEKRLEVWPIDKIVPYENNPRKNDQAVPDVVESIKQCENLDPIEVDENGVILSGHTRLKALKQLEYEKTEVLVYSGLTEEQKRKYRLLANKTGEKAGWEWAKLEEELENLDFGDFDFGFSDTGAGTDLDSLFTPAAEPEGEEESKEIQCPHCGEWFIP